MRHCLDLSRTVDQHRDCATAADAPGFCGAKSRRKPVVYLFTAPGCASCADQAHALATAAQGRPSVQLVGVDLINDKPSDFAAYVSAIGLAESRFIWTIDQDGGLARRFGIVNLSSSAFIASDGHVRFVNSGPQDPSTLGTQLGQLS